VTAYPAQDYSDYTLRPRDEEWGVELQVYCDVTGSTCSIL